jgi:hypothetical protein
MSKKLTPEEEELAQKLARYENICEEHSIELRKYPREDVFRAYSLLQDEIGVKKGQSWEPTTRSGQDEYIARLEALFLTKAESVVDHYKLANTATTLLACTLRWYLPRIPQHRRLAVELRQRQLVKPLVFPDSTLIPNIPVPTIPLPRPAEILKNRESLLELVFQSGDGDEMFIWQVVELKASRSGWTYSVIDGEGDAKEFDEQTLQSLLERSSVIA